MTPSRHDRCFVVYLPADRPDQIPENATLVEELLRGRPVIASYTADDKSGPRLVVVLGPVPEKPGPLVVPPGYVPSEPIERGVQDRFFWNGIRIAIVVVGISVIAPVVGVLVAHALRAW